MGKEIDLNIRRQEPGLKINANDLKDVCCDRMWRKDLSISANV